MSFLRRVAGLSLRERVRSSVIRRELGVEPLLLRVERSQLRWFGHLIWMPPGRLPLEVFQARRPQGKTQDTVEGLYLQGGLGTPQDPPECAGKCCGWEGSLGQPAGSAASATRPRMRMYRWEDKIILYGEIAGLQ